MRAPCSQVLVLRDDEDPPGEAKRRTALKVEEGIGARAVTGSLPGRVLEWRRGQ